LNRATDVMLGGKIAGRLRLRRGRQGLRRVAARPGLPRDRHRDRPICALQAAMQGYEVATLEDYVEQRRRLRHQRPATTTSSPPTDGAMKDKAIVGNIGHFDNEIDMAGLAKVTGIKKDQHQAAVRRVGLPRRPLDPRSSPRAGS
jgi:adenosylhomocysteinase